MQILLSVISLFVVLIMWQYCEDKMKSNQKYVGRFKKVTPYQFIQDFRNSELPRKQSYSETIIYDCINLPTRATSGSAGYDFYSPFGFILHPGESIKFPTGIRAEIDDGWVLQIYPRSSLGIKHSTVLANTVGIIDSDYSKADNEGHIWVMLTNNGGEPLRVNFGDRIVQGIFVPYGITYDDETNGKRTGGIGSSGK